MKFTAIAEILRLSEKPVDERPIAFWRVSRPSKPIPVSVCSICGFVGRYTWRPERKVCYSCAIGGKE